MDTNRQVEKLHTGIRVGRWLAGLVAGAMLAACSTASPASPTVQPTELPPFPTSAAPTDVQPSPTPTSPPPTDMPPSATISATTEPPATAELSSDLVGVNFVNNLDRVICRIYVFDSSLDNYVGALWELRPGGSVEIVKRATDVYTVYSAVLLDCDHNVVFWNEGMLLERGQMYELIISEPADTLRVVNASADPICTLSIVRTPTDAVGVDLVNDEYPIPPGGERVFALPFGGPAAVTATTCGVTSQLVTDDLRGEGEWTISD